MIRIVSSYKQSNQVIVVQFPAGILKSVKAGCGYQPVSISGYDEDLSPGEKQQGHEADRSPPTSANVNNAATSPLPSYSVYLYTGITYSTSDTTYYSCVVN